MTSLTLALPTTPKSSIEGYAKAIKGIPLLSVEDEQALAIRYQGDQDLEAARLLVMSHLRFVMHIANTYKGYGLSQADLIQEGNIGLMKAVKRFNPSLGVRLVSFAVHWIRAEIHEYILRNWRIVKVATTKSQRKLFFNLRSSKKRWGWLTSLEVEKVARDLGVSTKDVLEMEMRLSTRDLSFESPTDGEEDETDSISPSVYLEDHRYDPSLLIEQHEWETHSQTQLHQALKQLDLRSQDILQKRWLNPEKVTLQVLAEHYQVSAERIRQIENTAIKKLKQNLNLFNQ